MPLVLEFARAKVNLTLAIRGRRPDGYHELASLVAFATSPADRVTLDTSGAPGISVTGPFADAIEGENLLSRVLDLVSPHLGRRSPGSVSLEKNLPVAAGIGGGSADAAALLRGFSRAYPDIAASIDWVALARRLGADVPACLASSTTWMTGIGATLTPVAELAPIAAVLANPCVPVPADKTARVFRALAAPPLAADAPAAPRPHLCTAATDQIAALARFGNDLTAAATTVVPAILDVLAALEACAGCRFARLSGAGPTAFGLFDDLDMAEAAAATLQRAQPSWWITATELGAA